MLNENELVIVINRELRILPLNPQNGGLEIILEKSPIWGI